MRGNSFENTTEEKFTESSYSARTNYLHAMKQFMASSTGSKRLPESGTIEEYFRYEKELSLHIQKILKQCH